MKGINHDSNSNNADASDTRDPNVAHATIGRFQSVGDLIENGWSNPEEANGEAYLRRVAAAGRTGVLRRVYPLLAPKVQQVRSVYSARHK